MRYFTWKLELVSNILWVIVDANLNIFLSFFTHHWLTKVFKKPEKLHSDSKVSSSSSSESTNWFTNPKIKTWRLPTAGHKTFFNKIVREYDKIMKSSDLKHLCDNVYSKEVSLPCIQKFVALVLFRCWKKAIFKKIKSDVSIVSSNNESEV